MVYVARLRLPIAPDTEAALPEYAVRRSTLRRVFPSGERVSPHLRQPHLVWRCIHFDTVCDPACGSGNFLIVAYRELRKIETDVIVAIREREGNTSMALDIAWEQKLSIGPFYGIELNWWPAKIAETAMFLVDHQANRELA